MRLISAALLGAAASLPALALALALAHASPRIPDPADAAAPVPAVTVPSAFDGYRPYSDTADPSWQALNQAVQNKPAMRAMKRDGGEGMPGGGHHPNHSKHGASTP